MNLALLVLGLSLHQQTSPDPRAYLFDGEAVALTMPAPSTDSAPSNAVASWPGWAGLAGPNPTFPTPFMGCGDWSGVEKSYLDNFGKPAVDWRLKIFILAKVDTLIQRKDGTWIDRRNELTGDRFIQTLNAIPQFMALVSQVTGGKLRIVPDVHIDPEPSRDTVMAGRPDFDHAYLSRYAASRINGGLYQADDKKYRGPYDSVLFIDPCDRLSQPRWVLPIPSSFEVNDTPAAEVSFDNSSGYSTDALAVNMFSAWKVTLFNRLSSRALPPPSNDVESIDWPPIVDFKEVPAATLLERLTRRSVSNSRGSGPPPLSVSPAISQRTFKTPNVQLSIIKDPAKGEVLQYQETRLSRAGGICCPATGIDTDKTPTLSVTYKTSSDQPLCFAFEGPNRQLGGPKWISLGRDPKSGDPEVPQAVSMPLTSDGAWHTVSLNLKSFGPAVSQISIGASPSASTMSTELVTPVTYEFSEFRLGSDAPTPPLPDPTPDAASTDPQCRQLAALEDGKKGQPSPILLKLLADSDTDVVMNALMAYSSIIDPAAEPKIIELAKSPSPRIAEFALKALAHQNTATANAAIDAELKFGFEYNKEIAAGLIALRKDPKTAQNLVVLLAGQLWHTRLAAVTSLAQIPGPSAGLMRLAMLDQDDPEIKLAVIASTDPQSDTDMRKMLWEAVNEPSDAVRAAACERLIRSDLPDMRTQGLKGVRDDSWWTRVLVLRYLQANPLEAARGSIRLGLQDNSAKVRTAALLALNSLETVSLDEVQSALSDQNPSVERALIALAKKHKLALPDATLQMFKRSPDASVEAAWQSS